MGFKDAMMGFAGKLGSSIDKGISSGKEGYNKLSDRGRIKRETDQLTAEINNIMLNVGKALYAADPENEKFKQEFSDIKAKEEKLEILRKELEELDKQPEPAPAQPEAPVTPTSATVTCKACGENIPAESHFCDKCGAKQ